MITNSSRAAGVAFLVGAFLLLAGVWALLSPFVFGVIPVNHVLPLVYFLLGLGALFVTRARASGYLGFLGVVLTALGLLCAAPGTRDLIEHNLSLSRAGAVVDVALGLICLMTASGTRAVVVHEETDHSRGRPAV